MSGSEASKVKYESIRRDVYHTLVYLINGKVQFDLYLSHIQSDGDLMNEYEISCEYCSGGITTSKLILNYHPSGWLRRGNKHISADIWIYLCHGRGDVTWNNEPYVYVSLPIYDDKGAGLNVIPGLLIKGTRSDDALDDRAKAEAAIDAELLKQGVGSIESVNILIHAMKHFFVIMSALESNRGWNHSVQESWMKTFVASSIAGTDIVKTYTLTVRSYYMGWSDRNFDITADPLTEECTVHTKESIANKSKGTVVRLSDFKAFIDGLLAFNGPSPPFLRAMPSFHQQYLDIDRRVDMLRLH